MQLHGTRAAGQGPHHAGKVDPAGVAHLADNITYVAQQEPRDRMRPANMIGRLTGSQSRGDVELQAESSEVVPKRVVKIPRYAQALGGAAALGKQ